MHDVWSRIGIAACLVAGTACGGGSGPQAPSGPVGPVNVIAFTEVAAFAGIAYQVIDTQMADERGLMSGGAAAADYDRDGYPDLLVTRTDDSPILYHNNGDGTFTDVSAAAGLNVPLPELGGNGVCWGDIENDGDLDFYVSSVTGLRNHLFINDGSGFFTEEAVVRGADISSAERHGCYGVTMGDYDEDGYLDIFVVEWGNNYDDMPPAMSHARLLRNLGMANPGHFEDRTTFAGVDTSQSQHITAAGVAPGTGAWGFAPRFTDLDRDGNLDLIIAADFQTSKLFWSNGDGTFTDGTVAAGVATDENGMGSTVMDYDLDGDLDWFVTSIFDPVGHCPDDFCAWLNSGNRLYRNEGGRVFSDQTDAAGVRNGHWGWGATFFDMDNDRDPDLVMTNGVPFTTGANPLAQLWGADPMKLWMNENGRFFDRSDAYGVNDTQMGKGLLVFDYDCDGDLDIFVVNNGGSPLLFRNDGGNAWDWLRVRTIGTLSNRDGLGAWVTVMPDALNPALQLVREVDGGCNYLGHNELVCHFGLGENAAAVPELRVQFQRSAEQTFTNLPVNRTLTVIEGEGLVGDLDGDATLSAADQVALTLAINDLAAFMVQFPTVDASSIGDLDFDGDLDADDETALAALLP